MSYRVCILGASLEIGNMGVSALSVSLIKNVIDRIPDAEIILIISNHQPTVRLVAVGAKQVQGRSVNFRLSPRSKAGEHLFWILLLAIFCKLLPFPELGRRIIASNPMLQTLSGADFI